MLDILIHTRLIQSIIQNFKEKPRCVCLFTKPLLFWHRFRPVNQWDSNPQPSDYELSTRLDNSFLCSYWIYYFEHEISASQLGLALHSKNLKWKLWNRWTITSKHGTTHSLQPEKLRNGRHGIGVNPIK